MLYQPLKQKDKGFSQEKQVDSGIAEGWQLKHAN